MPCPCSLFQLREDVASCQPLATALDNGQVILCDRIADPWVGIPALHGGPAPRLPKPLQSPGAAPALPARLSSAASPCRTPSGSAWDAAPSSSSPTSSSPSDSPNTSAPSATGSCERQAGTGGTRGRGMWAPHRPAPRAFFFSFAALRAQRRPVPSTSPVSRRSSSRTGLCRVRCPRSCHKPVPGPPGAPTNPCPSTAGLRIPLSPLRPWIPLTSLPRCPLGSGVLPERGAPRRSGSLRHLFLGGLPEPG